MISVRARSTTLCWILLAAAVWLFVPHAAEAGNIYVLQCPHCLSVNDFKAAAGAAAAQRGWGGTFLVIGVNNPYSAYIRVSGQRATTCGPHGECQSYFRVMSIASVTSGGSPAGSTEDLARNDAEVFGTSRPQRIPPVQVPSEYQSSIINSLDEEIGPGISAALVARGINPGQLPVGTVVTVKFDDGTSATFKKVSNSTLMWEWTGHAWDEDGNPIHRDGSPKSNTNAPGLSGGSAEYSFRDREGANVVYTMTTSTKCITIVSISWNGVRWGTWMGYTSCP